MLGALRVTDVHVCPITTPPPAHVGGPIMPPCSTNVRTNSLPQARGGDIAMCIGKLDYIVTGAATVRVNGKPAARLDSKTLHHASFTTWSTNVRIGGPAAGVELGHGAKWLEVCKTAAAGRPRNADGTLKMDQSFDNCGVESARQIVIANGANPTEAEFLAKAINGGYASDNPDPDSRGGTTVARRQALLKSQGIDSSPVSDPAAVNQGIADGDGVIAARDAGALWHDPSSVGTGHAVLITGVQFNADGSVKAYRINDTGQGICGRVVPIDEWNAAPAQMPDGSEKPANVTKEPVT